MKTDNLINRQDTIVSFCSKDCGMHPTECNMYPCFEISIIEEEPSAEPSQIYCYECKHYDTQECMGRNAFYGLKDDDYCSWAELVGEQE